MPVILPKLWYINTATYRTHLYINHLQLTGARGWRSFLIWAGRATWFGRHLNIELCDCFGDLQISIREKKDLGVWDMLVPSLVIEHSPHLLYTLPHVAVYFFHQNWTCEHHITWCPLPNTLQPVKCYVRHLLDDIMDCVINFNVLWSYCDPVPGEKTLKKHTGARSRDQIRIIFWRKKVY